MDFFSKIMQMIDSLLAGPLSLKNRIANSVKQDDDGTHFFVLHHTRFTFPRDSWEMARKAGVTNFADVIGKLHKNTFRVFDAIAKMPEVETVRISSAWRPGDAATNVHAAGRALDIGEITYTLENVFYSRTHGDEKLETIPAFNFRRALWDTGLLWQWIGPWKIKYTVTGPWLDNDGGTEIQRQHLNHVHLTIGA